MNPLYDDRSHSPEDEPPPRSVLQRLRRCASRQFEVVLSSWTMILYMLSLIFTFIKSNLTWRIWGWMCNAKDVLGSQPDLWGKRLKSHRRMCKGHSLQVNNPQARNTWYSRSVTGKEYLSVILKICFANFIFACLFVQSLYLRIFLCKPYLCVSLDNVCEVFQVGCWTRLRDSTSMTWKRKNCLHGWIKVFLETWKRGGGDPGPVIGRVARRTGDQLQQITHLHELDCGSCFARWHLWLLLGSYLMQG